MQYLVVVEKADTNYAAYAPDVRGCVATGATVAETLENYRDALQMHLEAMVRDGEDLPHPYSVESAMVAVSLPAPALA